MALPSCIFRTIYEIRVEAYIKAGFSRLQAHHLAVTQMSLENLP